jgi:hypothetical protein
MEVWQALHSSTAAFVDILWLRINLRLGPNVFMTVQTAKKKIEEEEAKRRAQELEQKKKVEERQASSNADKDKRRKEKVHCAGIVHPTSCHHVNMSSCHHVIMSSCHHVIMSSCHHVIMSSCHHVIVRKETPHCEDEHEAILKCT